MAKDAVVQIRIDSEMKSEVEALYARLGSSFAEAVRLFAAQSIAENGLPFQPRAARRTQGSQLGRLSRYARQDIESVDEVIELENKAIRQVHREKYLETLKGV